MERPSAPKRQVHKPPSNERKIIYLASLIFLMITVTTLWAYTLPYKFKKISESPTDKNIQNIFQSIQEIFIRSSQSANEIKEKVTGLNEMFTTTSLELATKTATTTPEAEIKEKLLELKKSGQLLPQE